MKLCNVIRHELALEHLSCMQVPVYVNIQYLANKSDTNSNSSLYAKRHAHCTDVTAAYIFSFHSLQESK